MTDARLHGAVLTLIDEVRQLAKRFDALENRLAPAAPAEADPSLRSACAAREIPVSVDGYVDELGAAVLLGISRRGLKARRIESRLPEQLQRYRRNLGRIEYRLAAIAEYLQSCQQNEN